MLELPLPYLAATYPIRLQICICICWHTPIRLFAPIRSIKLQLCYLCKLLANYSCRFLSPSDIKHRCSLYKNDYQDDWLAKYGLNDMSMPSKSAFQDIDADWIIATAPEQTIRNLYITNMVLPPDVSKPSETTMLEHGELFTILYSVRSGFTGTERNCSHQYVADPTFYSQSNTTKAWKMAKTGVNHSGFHYVWIDPIAYTTTSTYTAIFICSLSRVQVQGSFSFVKVLCTWKVESICHTFGQWLPTA